MSLSFALPSREAFPPRTAGSLDAVEIKLHAMSSGLADNPHHTSVEAAIGHHLRAGGGRFRAKLALSVSSALNLQADDSEYLAAACELLHNASLIHDDIQDGDRLRRGRETVWSLFGADVAICAGDLLISCAYAALAEVSASRKIAALTRLLHQRVAEAIHGQMADLSFHRSGSDSFELYEKIAAFKSGSLLSLPLELPLVYAGHSAFAATARAAGRAFAIGYQITDDLDDVARDTYANAGKGAPNAVLVLRAAGFGPGAEDEAKARARKLFETAAEKSRALPYRSGAALAEAAAKLSAKL